MSDSYFVVRDKKQILDQLKFIQEHADAERDALGFLPEIAYEEAAYQGKLILLERRTGTESYYAGHLLFGGTFPRLKVRQICIAPELRKHGLASTLLRALIAKGEHEGHLSVTAHVATDLDAANSFYGKHGFETQRLREGGKTRGRQINVRELSLKTPSLLDLMDASASKAALDSIPIAKRSEVPIYSIDLNLFFDIIKDRLKSEKAGEIVEAALSHQIRLATSQEFIAELERNAADKSNDPVLAFAKHIPRLPRQDESTINKLAKQLEAIIFPKENLKASDKSDALHIAHAIAAGANGYITGDKEILNARDQLIKIFDFDVMGSSEFASLISTPTSIEIDQSKRTKYFRITAPQSIEVINFLEKQLIDVDNFLPQTEFDSCSRFGIADSNGLIGVGLIKLSAAIDKPSRAVVGIVQNHPFSGTIADHLISEIVRQSSHDRAGCISLLDIPSHAITRRVAVGQGFHKQGNEGVALVKIASGKLVTRHSWSDVRMTIDRLSGMKLPTKCPRYDQPEISVQLSDGTNVTLQLSELESLLSPVIFALPKRTAVVVPIKAGYSEALLGATNQMSLLEFPEAQFLTRKTYFNTTNAVRAMIRGSAVVFYESGKHGAAVAIGRIVDVISVEKSAVPEMVQRGGVIEDFNALTLTDRVLATTFDNVIPLKRPVTFRELKALGCTTGANFITATPITTEQLEKIIEASSK